MPWRIGLKWAVAPRLVERHHQRGKLTARERLALLFDAGSFVEVNKLAESQSVDFGMQEKKVPGDGVVTGYGTIAGRLGLLPMPRMSPCSAVRSVRFTVKKFAGLWMKPSR